MMNKTVKELYERKLVSAHDTFSFASDIKKLHKKERWTLSGLLSDELHSIRGFIALSYNLPRAAQKRIETRLEQIDVKRELIADYQNSL